MRDTKSLKKSVDNLISIIEKEIELSGSNIGGSRGPVRAKTMRGRIGGELKPITERELRTKKSTDKVTKCNVKKERLAGRKIASKGSKVRGNIGGIESAISEILTETPASKVGGALGAAPMIKKQHPTAGAAIGAGIGAGLTGGSPIGAGIGSLVGEKIGSKVGKPKEVESVEKGWKKVAGTIGGALVGGAAGNIPGAIVGGIGGHKIGAEAEKPKAIAPAIKPESTIHVPVTKKECKKVEKGVVGAGLGGLTGAAIGGLVGHPLVGAGIGAGIGSEVDKCDEDEEDIKARKEADKARSKAMLKVEKAISYLQGFEPMSDEAIMKSFHGTIPDLMKSSESRPPQTWWDKAITKATELGEIDPIRYSLDLWYGDDISKAVAEELDSEIAPQKRGEEDKINDGTRVSVRDLKPSNTLITN